LIYDITRNRTTIDHPLRPVPYRPLDDFWTKCGYQKEPRLQSQFDWPDIGEAASTPKPMVYWLRRSAVRESGQVFNYKDQQQIEYGLTEPKIEVVCSKI